jgi:hypothetical protein
MRLKEGGLTIDAMSAFRQWHANDACLKTTQNLDTPPWLEESAKTGESWATPRLGAKDPDHLLKIVQDLDQHNYREVNYTSAHFQHERRDHDR